MKRLIRDIVCGAIRWCGLAWLVRRTVARRRVSILTYHDPSPEVFDRHLEYLERHYSVVSLDEVVGALYEGGWRELPHCSVVLTFDDAYKGNRRLLELLRGHHVRATIYACSQIVDTSRHFWWLHAGQRAEELSALPHRRRMEVLRSLGFDLLASYGAAGRQTLNREEMHEMQSCVEFGSHTRLHPILITCDDEECKEEIESLTGRPCRHFAYPNGEYTERELRLVGRANYLSARTSDLGWNGRRTDPFRLKVLGTLDAASVSRLAADLAGFTLIRAVLAGRRSRARWRGPQIW